jgi:site-specific recombinase XerD
MHQSATRRLESAPGQVPANKGRRYRAEVLSQAEADALIAACSATSRTGIRNRALITVLYRAGLRISEALGLRPADVDPERGTVRVMDGKGHKPRTVGLDPGAMATIQRWADKRRQAGIRCRVLLCTLAGGPMSPQYARAMLARTAAKAGIDRGVVPHQLRHTHAAELVAEGVPSRSSGTSSGTPPSPSPTATCGTWPPVRSSPSCSAGSGPSRLPSGSGSRRRRGLRG